MTAAIASYTDKELRSRYQATWSRNWPGGNKYLTELWFEAKEALGIPRISRKYNTEAVRKYTLITMRENHPFTPNN